MGVNTISFRGHEFLAHDAYSEIWLWLVSKEIDRQNAPPEWLREVREDWFTQATQGFGFGIEPLLDGHLDDTEKVAVMRSIFSDVLQSLESRTTDFSPEELTDAGIGGADVIHAEPTPRRLIWEVGRQFLDLLRD